VYFDGTNAVSAAITAAKELFNVQVDDVHITCRISNSFEAYLLNQKKAGASPHGPHSSDNDYRPQQSYDNQRNALNSPRNRQVQMPRKGSREYYPERQSQSHGQNQDRQSQQQNQHYHATETRFHDHQLQQQQVQQQRQEQQKRYNFNKPQQPQSSSRSITHPQDNTAGQFRNQSQVRTSLHTYILPYTFYLLHSYLLPSYLLTFYLLTFNLLTFLPLPFYRARTAHS
jgi:hypothetical protein